MMLAAEGPNGAALAADIAALLEDEGPRHRKFIHKKKEKAGPKPRKGKVPIALPITVRSLSEAIGMRAGELLMKLMSAGAAQNVNINSMLEAEMAEALALEHGVELEVKRQLDIEEQLLADFKKPDEPEDLRPRAPVVTIMGHVDHGKTSLLDKIRQSNVVATEAGGITQVIRAWRVDHGGRPITFLDTPGHEAFTAMRARGAEITDIAVLVVAADDGVMPQTVEALNHARAANVPIIVAVNKIDKPESDPDRVKRELSNHGLVPEDWGGQTIFVGTSAKKGTGIDQLLEMTALQADVLELKANPDRNAIGTIVDAHLERGRGPVATVLVQAGTLKVGDDFVCGHIYHADVCEETTGGALDVLHGRKVGMSCGADSKAHQRRSLNQRAAAATVST